MVKNHVQTRKLNRCVGGTKENTIVMRHVHPAQRQQPSPHPAPKHHRLNNKYTTNRPAHARASYLKDFEQHIATGYTNRRRRRPSAVSSSIPADEFLSGRQNGKKNEEKNGRRGKQARFEEIRRIASAGHAWQALGSATVRWAQRASKEIEPEGRVVNSVERDKVREWIHDLQQEVQGSSCWTGLLEPPTSGFHARRDADIMPRST